MKPAIYYTLRGNLYSGTFETIAVTSEQPSRYSGKMLYGRDRHGCPTHFIATDSHGRFASEADAAACLDAVARARDKFNDDIKSAEARLIRLRGEQRQAVIDAVTETTR